MMALGEALADRFVREASRARILLGMDTRESGPEIANALMAGIRKGGGEAVFIGVIPTPAVAYLCRTSDATAGISISASHNPYEDNGVKVFGHDGMKLPDAIEKDIEQDLLAIRNQDIDVPQEALIESPALVESSGYRSRRGIPNRSSGISRRWCRSDRHARSANRNQYQCRRRCPAS